MDLNATPAPPGGKRLLGLLPRVVAIALTTLVVGSCGTSQVLDTGTSTPQPFGDVTEATPSTPSALKDPRNVAFPGPLIDPDLLVAGGPPPDGIPPIDDPTFEVAREVDWLRDDEAVLILTVMGDTRAYPLQIMMWHEIVNDTVGGVEVAVTYCPLCNSGVAFERTVDGQDVLSFGTSGLLYADNLVMYDRQTESLWPQLTGIASVGSLTGIELISMPMGTVAWSEFLASHPDGGVLSRDTGLPRAYGENPYGQYDDPDSDVMFPLPFVPDDRLRPKERVVGITDGASSLAIVRKDLVGRAPVEVLVGARRLVVWHQPGQASALDADTVAGGADIGSVAVFDPLLNGRALHFRVNGDGFVDRETGSTWNILGEATAGELKGENLLRHGHLDTFWFSWVSFHPASRIVSPGD